MFFATEKIEAQNIFVSVDVFFLFLVVKFCGSQGVNWLTPVVMALAFPVYMGTLK